MPKMSISCSVAYLRKETTIDQYIQNLNVTQNFRSSKGKSRERWKNLKSKQRSIIQECKVVSTKGKNISIVCQK